MTESQGNPPESAEPAKNSPAPKPKGSHAKLVFLAVLILAGGFLWWNQRKDIRLEGWGENLPAARQQAAKEDKKVVVFFSSKPYNGQDKALIENALTTDRTKEKLAKAPILLVAINTKDNADQAQEFKVKTTPTCILLDRYGKELARKEGPMNDLTFYGEFLGIKD